MFQLQMPNETASSEMYEETAHSNVRREFTREKELCLARDQPTSQFYVAEGKRFQVIAGFVFSLVHEYSFRFVTSVTIAAM
jgi:hypothetical protein